MSCQLTITKKLHLNKVWEIIVTLFLGMGLTEFIDANIFELTEHQRRTTKA